MKKLAEKRNSHTPDYINHLFGMAVSVKLFNIVSVDNLKMISHTKYHTLYTEKTPQTVILKHNAPL